eukprot:scaffold131341_cov31-Tisochrysis_lutea.AAC.6
MGGRDRRAHERTGALLGYHHRDGHLVPLGGCLLAPCDAVVVNWLEASSLRGRRREGAGRRGASSTSTQVSRLAYLDAAMRSHRPCGATCAALGGAPAPPQPYTSYRRAAFRVPHPSRR